MNNFYVYLFVEALVGKLRTNRDKKNDHLRFA